MQGLHLTADLYRCRCDSAWLTDAALVGPWCMQAAHSCGLQPISHLAQAFPDAGPHSAGVTTMVLLEGSHLCLHTWPQQRGVTLDVYVGNASGEHPARARALMDALVGRFAPEWTEQRSLDRGDGE